MGIREIFKEKEIEEIPPDVKVGPEFTKNALSSGKKQISITLSEELLNNLQTLRKYLLTEDGKEYPLSWLIEDMLLFYFEEPERLSEFLRELFQPIPEEIEGGEKSEIHLETKPPTPTGTP